MPDRLAAIAGRIDRLIAAIGRVISFVVIQLIALVVLWSAQGLATMLPHKLYGRGS